MDKFSFHVESFGDFQWVKYSAYEITVWKIKVIDNNLSRLTTANSYILKHKRPHHYIYKVVRNFSIQTQNKTSISLNCLNNKRTIEIKWWFGIFFVFISKKKYFSTFFMLIKNVLSNFQKKKIKQKIVPWNAKIKDKMKENLYQNAETKVTQMHLISFNSWLRLFIDSESVI